MPAEEREQMPRSLSVTVVRALMRAVKVRSYPAECSEQSGRSEETESSKQSLLSRGFPTGLRLRGTKAQRDSVVRHFNSYMI